jgi:hypothetical protein
MRFLRPLLGLTRLDRQRHPDIRNRLKVDNSRRHKVVSKKSRPPGTNANLADGGIWEDRDEDGETKNTLSFKGTGLKT